MDDGGKNSTMYPAEVIDKAKYLSRYFLGLVKQVSINKQMLERFDNPNCDDRALYQQTYQFLLCRPYGSSVAASASDVWKCCVVLDCNWGFRLEDSPIRVDCDFTNIAHMSELLLGSSNQDEIRHQMLKISIEVAQREFPKVSGLTISKSFSLNLCGYKCKKTPKNQIPEGSRLDKYTDAPPCFKEIRRRFELAVECYTERTDGESTTKVGSNLTAADALAWTRKPSPDSQAADTGKGVPRLDPKSVDKVIPETLLNPASLLKSSLLDGVPEEEMDDDYTNVPPLLRVCVQNAEEEAMYVCENPFDFGESFPGFVPEDECSATDYSFVRRIRGVLSGCPLNVEFGGTKQTDAEMMAYNYDAEDNVKIYNISHSEDKQGSNAIIIYDPFDDKFVDWQLSCQDEVPYLESTKIGSSRFGKEKIRSTRIFSPKPSMVFQLSNDQKFLGCSPTMTTAEKALTKCVCGLMNLSDDEVRKVSRGRIFPFWSPKKVLCQTVAANMYHANYDIHDDGSLHHNHNSRLPKTREEIFEEHIRLPSKGYLRVATVILSKYKGMNAKVQWYEVYADGRKQHVKTIETSGNCIHIQSFKTNALFVHCVVTLDGIPTEEPRVVFSFRQSIAPEGNDYIVFQQQLAANFGMSLNNVHNDYSCTRVLSAIKARLQFLPGDFKKEIPKHASFVPVLDIPDETNAGGGLSPLEIGAVTLQTDRWKAVIKPEDEPPLPDGLQADNDPFWLKCLKLPFQLILRKYKIQTIFEYKSKDGTTHRALHGRVEELPIVNGMDDEGNIVRLAKSRRPLPGQLVPKDALRGVYRLPDTNYSNPSWTSVHTSMLNAVLHTKDYKTNNRQIGTAQQQLKTDGSRVPCVGYSTHGSGGAKEQIGQRAMDLASAVQGQRPASSIVAKAQDPDTALNRTILGTAFHGNFLPVFVPRLIPGRPALWNGSMAKVMQFMGYYYPRSCRIEELSETEYNDFVQNLSASSKDNASFLTERHLTLHMEPVPDANYEKDNDPDWQTIIVPVNDDTPHYLAIVKKKGETIFDGKRLLREEFEKTKPWKEFLSNSVDSDCPEPELPSKLRVSFSDAMIALMCIQVGFAYRVARRNVVCEDKGTIQYLPWRDKVIGQIGLYACTTASPSTVRSYDCSPSMNMLLSENSLYSNKGLSFPGHRAEVKDLDRDTFVSIVLTALILRLFGRVERIRAFLLFMRRHKVEEQNRAAQADGGESGRETNGDANTTNNDGADRVNGDEETSACTDTDQDQSGPPEPQVGDCPFRLIAPDDIDLFVAWVEATGKNPDGTWKSQSMSALISDQHKARLPLSATQDIPTFAHFMTYVKDNIGPLADAMISFQVGDKEPSDTIGNEMIALIKDFLSRAISNKDYKKGGDFVAAQLAYDVNESVNLLHEERQGIEDDVVRLIFGHGGKQGGSVLEPSQDQNDLLRIREFLQDKEVKQDVLQGLIDSGAEEEARQEMEKLILDSEPSAAVDAERTVDETVQASAASASTESEPSDDKGNDSGGNGRAKRALEPSEHAESPNKKKKKFVRSKLWKKFMRQFLSQLKKGNDKMLRIFGLQRDRHGRVVVAYNKRPLSIIDIEHMCCKLYLALSRSYGTRAYNKPNPSRPHCPPTRSKDLVPQRMMDIMLESIETFEEMARAGTWPLLPLVFWMAGEEVTCPNVQANADPGNNQAEVAQSNDDPRNNIAEVGAVAAV